MTTPRYVRIAYEWQNPYHDPPDGKPRVMVETFYRYGDAPRQLPSEIQAVSQLGDGYGVTWTFISEPLKQQPPEWLAVTRQKRLRRRVEKKYPLFAEQFIGEAVEQNPEYFAGITRADIQERKDAVIQGELERIEYIEKYLKEKGR